jgi:uncharacterized membrane protein YedE/YeeE
MSFSSLPAYLPSLAGGILIGLASLLASGATGKIPGISGILSRTFQAKPGETAWRLVFLLGLIAGAGLAFAFFESAAQYRPLRPMGLIVVAGLLVGFGTRIGGGCTSGHGVCGIGLGSRSSIVATLVFMAAGIGTVWLLKQLGGVAP